MEDRPRISTLLSSLSNYSNTIPAVTDPDARPPPVQGGARMGTPMGVFLPCIQNIFGVILFIRLTWVVGTAGAVQGFFIVLCCCCVVSNRLEIPLAANLPGKLIVSIRAGVVYRSNGKQRCNSALKTDRGTD